VDDKGIRKWVNALKGRFQPSAGERAGMHQVKEEPVNEIVF